MRPRASALLRAAAVAVVVYVAALFVWRAVEPIYMHALAVFLEAADAAGVLPTSVQAVLVPGRGLALVGVGVTPIAIPQRIISSDLALFVALLAVTSWLSWRQRARRLAAGLLAVFAMHLGTLVAQTWVASGPSTSVSAAWNLWTTLYQGKVVPVAIWCLLCVPFAALDARPRVRSASARVKRS